MTVIEKITWATKVKGIAKSDMHFIFRELFALSQTQLLASYPRTLTKDEEQLVDDKISEMDGRPVQYLFFKAYFLGLPMYVNSDVLIPRYETEELALIANSLLRPGYHVLDLCTGSGALAIYFKKVCPEAQVSASDISVPALKVARKNAKAHQVEIKFIRSDLFKSIRGTFDLIVSNPPYIAFNDEDIDPQVKRYEPSIALFAGEDGLDFYRRIIAKLDEYLSPQGVALLEFGYTQRKAILDIVSLYPTLKAKIIKDINNLDRIIKIERNTI